MIIYSIKKFYQIIIPCTIIVVAILYKFIINDFTNIGINSIIIFIIIFIILALILWLTFGRIKIEIFDNYIVIKKIILFFTFSKKKIQINDLNKVYLLKDCNSNYSINFGIRYYFKFDYCIVFQFKDKSEDYLLDIGAKENKPKIISFFETNNVVLFQT